MPKQLAGDNQGAIVDYSKAIRIDPQYASAYSARGKCKLDLGDKTGAIADYRQADTFYRDREDSEMAKKALDSALRLEKP